MMSSRSHPAPRRFPRVLVPLWLLGAAALAGGVVEWLFLGGLPWEGVVAAMTIAGVTKLVADVRGLPAWPWSEPQPYGKADDE